VNRQGIKCREIEPKISRGENSSFDILIFIWHCIAMDLTLIVWNIRSHLLLA